MDWYSDDHEDETIEAGYAGQTESGLFTWTARSIDTPDLPADTYDFVASSGTVDRMRDSIDQSSWILRHFRRNPVILYEHSKPVVGRGLVKVVTLDDGNKELRSRITFDNSEANPTGMLVAHQHANGFRKAVSVGFKPGERIFRTDLPADHPLHVDPKSVPWAPMAGSLYKNNELLEISSVAVPAHRDALQLSLDTRNAENQDQAFQKYLSETLPRAVKEIVLDAIRRDETIRRAIQAQTLGSTPSKPTGLRWFPEE